MELGSHVGTLGAMSHLTWSERPSGDRPTLVAAFEGWNDAGDAATTAVEHLSTAWAARQVASIDPEEFYDFTATRPLTKVHDGRTRRIEWPANTFSWAEPPGTGGVVLLRGVEPQLRWRTFCAEVLEVARETGCSMLFTLGALLADVPHTRPTAVFGNAYDPSVIERLGLEPSHYEGPTGIVGVLHAECAAAGLDSASLWAAVPGYVPSVPSPKAASALVQRAGELLGSTPVTTELDQLAEGYEEQITRLVEEDETTADYVRHLEEQHDQDALAVQSADSMVEEVERFLREQ